MRRAHPRTWRWLTATALALGAPFVARAGEVFRWVDRQGNLHLSDELAQVPEPYYGLYQAQIRAREEARRSAGGTPANGGESSTATAEIRPPASVAPREVAGPGEREAAMSVSEQEAARRRSWKALVAEWRAQLTAATDELAAADDALAAASHNPILRETPAGRGELEQAVAARARSLARVETARRMLLETLPARARREGVPPAWLL